MPIRLIEKPSPDFSELERVLKGEQEGRRVHIVELMMDEEVLQFVTEQALRRISYPIPVSD